MLMHEAKFSFEVVSNSPMKKVMGVNLSTDKKKANYTFKISDIINNNDKMKFLISL